MTQRIFVALLTVAVFFAGYAARGWNERGHHVPPPPAALASEYAPATSQSNNKAEQPPVDRAKILAEIEKLRPQIEAYRAQVEEIYAEFDREFVAILTPAQRQKYVANQQRWIDHSAKKKLADVKPLTDDDILRAREQLFTDIYWKVTVTPRLERLTKEYELDAPQQTSVRALLTLRRNKFIALLDGTPHPNIRLSQLAPMIERLGLPAKR